MKNTELGPPARTPADSEERMRMLSAENTRLREALDAAETKASGISAGLAHGWGGDRPWRWKGEKAADWLKLYADAAYELHRMLEAAAESYPALGEARGTASASESHVGFVDVVFDGPPEHEAGRFVEVEDANGHGVKAGFWIDRGNGTWALRIAAPNDVSQKVLEIIDRSERTVWDATQTREAIRAALATVPAPDLLRENARLHLMGAHIECTTDQCEIAREVFVTNKALEEELTRARAAHLENAELLAKAKGLLCDVRPTLDDINGLLGGEGDPEGECVARNAGLLRDRIDLLLADRTGTAPQAPLDPAAAAAPAKEGKKP